MFAQEYLARHLMLAEYVFDLFQLRNHDVQLTLNCESLLLVTAADHLWKVQPLNRCIACLQTANNKILLY